MTEPRRERQKDDRRGKDEETDVSLERGVGRLESDVSSLKDQTGKQQEDIEWLKKNMYLARGAAVAIGVVLTLAVGAVAWIVDNRFDEIIRLLAPGG